MKTILAIIVLFNVLFAEKVTLLEVVGTASEDVIPNVMVFEFSVEAVDSVGSKANVSAKKIADRVLDTIRKLDSSAVFSNNGFYSSKEYQQPSTQILYRSSSNIRIVSKLVNQASKFYDAIVFSGAQRTSSPQFFVTNYDSIKNIVRKKAFENGKKKAEQIAASYESSISRLVGIKDSENAQIHDYAQTYYDLFDEPKPSGPQLFGAGLRSGVASGSLSDALMNSQTVKISHCVQLVYEFKR